jgi:hypothetical protein
LLLSLLDTQRHTANYFFQEIRDGWISCAAIASFIYDWVAANDIAAVAIIVPTGLGM